MADFRSGVHAAVFNLFNLAAMYGNGKGVPEDDKEAVKLYRLAAEQGHLSAQHKLGLMYDNGEGLPEDDKAAVKWYRLAADQGLA
ncbi:MAG: tetratricopeptide repeat protein, partial [Pseudomonadales bacterium]